MLLGYVFLPFICYFSSAGFLCIATSPNIPETKTCFAVIGQSGSAQVRDRVQVARLFTVTAASKGASTWHSQLKNVKCAHELISSKIQKISLYILNHTAKFVGMGGHDQVHLIINQGRQLGRSVLLLVHYITVFVAFVGRFVHWIVEVVRWTTLFTRYTVSVFDSIYRHLLWWNRRGGVRELYLAPDTTPEWSHFLGLLVFYLFLMVLSNNIVWTAKSRQNKSGTQSGHYLKVTLKLKEITGNWMWGWKKVEWRKTERPYWSFTNIRLTIYFVSSYL